MVAIEDVVSRDAIKEVATPYVDELIASQFSEEDLKALMRERLEVRLRGMFGAAPQMTNGAMGGGGEEDEPTQADPPKARRSTRSTTPRSSGGSSNRMPSVMIPASWLTRKAAPPKYSDAVRQLFTSNQKQAEFLRANAVPGSEFYPKLWGKLSPFFRAKDAEKRLMPAIASYGMGQNEESSADNQQQQTASESEA